jgi:hypothetical protein
VTWHKSLYWRIALGVVGFLAAMLIVQAILFVWVVSQSGRSLPGQSPARLGMTVALDLASVLERDPQVDLARYLHDQYAQYTHPFFVMLADGTVITSGSETVADPLLAMARAALVRWSERPPGRRGDRAEGPRFEGSRPDGTRPDGPRFERPIFGGPPDGSEGRTRRRARFFGRGGGDRFARRRDRRRTLMGVVSSRHRHRSILLGRCADARVRRGRCADVGTVLTSVMISARPEGGCVRSDGGAQPAPAIDNVRPIAAARIAVASAMRWRSTLGARRALTASDRVRRQLPPTCPTS